MREPEQPTRPVLEPQREHAAHQEDLLQRLQLKENGQWPELREGETSLDEQQMNTSVSRAESPIQSFLNAKYRPSATVIKSSQG